MPKRNITSLTDAASAIRDLQDWQSGFPKQNLDMHGFRIINAGDAQQPADLSTQQQLPVVTVTQSKKQSIYYTVVWERSGIAMTGDLIPDFDIGWGREGTPVEAWLDARGTPDGDTDDHSLRVQIDLVTFNSTHTVATVTDILENELKVTSDSFITLNDSTGMPVLDSSMNPVKECVIVSTRTFISPLPRLGRYMKVRPVIINGGNASVVSIGLVVQIIGAVHS